MDNFRAHKRNTLNRRISDVYNILTIFDALVDIILIATGNVRNRYPNTILNCRVCSSA